MQYLIVFLIAILSACDKSGSAGQEKGPCYGNDTCDEGLECLSETCVAPKYQTGLLGEVERLTDAACACKNQACLIALMAEGKLDALERLQESAPARADSLGEKLATCVESVPGALGQQVHSKRTKKAKTAEANQSLKKMADGARLMIAVQAKQFPKSVGPTPPLGTCCQDGGKCKPGSGNWGQPTWRALDFSMRDPHYFSYEFKSTKSGNEETFTALAYGDLDCDGKYSTFSLFGMIIDGEVQTAGDIIKVSPLE